MGTRAPRQNVASEFPVCSLRHCWTLRVHELRLLRRLELLRALRLPSTLRLAQLHPRSKTSIPIHPAAPRCTDARTSTAHRAPRGSNPVHHARLSPRVGKRIGCREAMATAARLLVQVGLSRLLRRDALRHLRAHVESPLHPKTLCPRASNHVTNSTLRRPTDDGLRHPLHLPQHQSYKSSSEIRHGQIST